MRGRGKRSQADSRRHRGCLPGWLYFGDALDARVAELVDAADSDET
jgi:hypothetical protein